MAPSLRKTAGSNTLLLSAPYLISFDFLASSEYTEEQEEHFETRKSLSVPRESTIMDEDLYDTVDNCIPEGEQPQQGNSLRIR